MNNEQMIIAFAKLEGLTFIIEYDLVMVDFGNGYEKYDPIEDKALNCAARDKYHVAVLPYQYENSGNYYTNLHIDGHSRIHAVMEKEIPKAVIECILKSEGLWE